MTYETKDMSRPFVHVPDAVAYRETDASNSDVWRSATCARCGGVSAGHSVAHVRPGDTWVCGSCVRTAHERMKHISTAQLKAAGFESPETVHSNALRDDIEWSMDGSGNLVRSVCSICDTLAGPVWGGHRVGDEWLCSWCAGGPSGWGVA